MKFYYKGIEKGSINEKGEIKFVDSELEEIKNKLFLGITAEETDEGTALYFDELSYELKISYLKELGFKLEGSD